MEKVHQIISADGLQIPLPLVERYGLRPGARVVLEFDDEGIRIVPELPDQQDIEDFALRYLLTNLGDAVEVNVTQQENEWHATVFGTGIAKPLGTLIYTASGVLDTDKSSTPKAMRELAVTYYQAK